ncbi:MAG TPA: B-box zinc finger protein [Terracidiphilus sp.]|jgi:TM2 domain-containing membrane protein YozV|nr:B-box zinc finger protein [Terracidiphilus sp.]
MDCVNHSGVTATAFCQNCGKAMCANCVRTGAGGQILCEPCWVAWQNIPNPFAPPPIEAPNPAAAAILGLIPGVGAMYNGQFFKGLIHVVIFAVLISITTHYGIFGIFIGAWVLYQSFEAFHTAKARRDGQPLPDPLGLNEVGNWLNLGQKPNYPPQPGAANPNPGAYSGPNPGAGPVGPGPGGPGAYPPPYGGQYQAPYQTPYQAPPPYAPAAGFTPVPEPGAPPMPPPPPPAYWRRKEPIGAIVLIGLGLLFLLGQLDVLGGRVFEFTWPLLLIGLGVWLVVRRMGDTQGGSR